MNNLTKKKNMNNLTKKNTMIMKFTELKLSFFYLTHKHSKLIIYMTLFIIRFGYSISNNLVYCWGGVNAYSTQYCETHKHYLISEYCTIRCPGADTCTAEGSDLFINVIQNIQQKYYALNTKISNLSYDQSVPIHLKSGPLRRITRRKERLEEDLDSAIDVYSRIS